MRNLVGLLGFGLAVDYAEAKRFGGGKSFGSYSRFASDTPSTPSRTASAPQRTPSQGLSRFAGPSFAGSLPVAFLPRCFLAAPSTSYAW